MSRQRPGPAQADLRNWEWRYLWQQCRGDELFVLGYHSNRVNTLALLKDGTTLASADLDGTVQLWDVPTRRKLAILQETGQCWSMTLSHDGNLLAIGGEENRQGQVWIHDVAERRLVTKLPHQGRVRSLVFSKDDKQLVTYEFPQNVGLWDLAKRQRSELQVSPRTGFIFHGGVVLFSPDDQMLAIGNMDGSIRFLDAHSWSERRSFQAHANSISALAFSPDGRLLASAYAYAATVIKVWNTATGQEVARLSGHTGWVSSLAFSPDGTKLISTSNDQTIRIWDVQAFRQIEVLQGNLDEVFCSAVSSDGQTLATGAKDGAIRFWEVAPNAKSKAFVTFPTAPWPKLRPAPTPTIQARFLVLHSSPARERNGKQTWPRRRRTMAPLDKSKDVPSGRR